MRNNRAGRLLFALLSPLILFSSHAVREVNANEVTLEADRLLRNADGVITATGGVVVDQPAQQLHADEVIYFPDDERMIANHHVTIVRDQDVIHADSAQLERNETAQFKHVQAQLRGGQYIEAETIEQLDHYRFSGDDLYLTYCPSDDAPWKLHAARADVDQDEGVLIAKHMRFEVLDMPIVYVPYWRQALRRGSGMMIPSFTTSAYRGSDWALPLYLAPASHWDATLTPHWTTALGLKSDLELRHASTFGREMMQYESVHDPRMGRSRYRIVADVDQKWLAGMHFSAKSDHLSDGFYFADMGTQLDRPYGIFTQSHMELSGTVPTTLWRVTGLHQQRLLAQGNANTLQILPRLQTQTTINIQAIDALFRLDHQTTQFVRQQGYEGARLFVQPSLEKQWHWMPAIQTTAKFSSQHTRYWMRNFANGQTLIRNSVGASLETRFELEHISDEKVWRHALTPIVRYDASYAPNQTQLPNFDSGFGQLSINNLLMGNRYSGLDRIERMQRLSLLIDNSWQHKSEPDQPAHQVGKLRIGAAYDFLRQSVDQAKVAPLHALSSLVADASLQPMLGMQWMAGTQYNPFERYFATSYAGVSLSSDDHDNIALHWSKTDRRYAAASELVTAQLQWMMGARWQAEGLWNYDLQHRFTQQSSVAMDYIHPCWDAKVEGFRQNVVGSTGLSNIGVRFMLGLKGLGGLGS
ncbi:MAG: LPS-assembly protein LptD [Zetaproteobacteria bacterium]|nr:LPS-assembly protein LptD [Zetaproteobacteria bacterium]